MALSDSQDPLNSWIRALEDTDNGTIRKWKSLRSVEIRFLVGLGLVLVLLAGFVTYFSIAKAAFNNIIPELTLILFTVFCAYFAVFGVIAERPDEMLCCLTSYVLLCITTTWISSYTGNGFLIARIVFTCMAWLIALVIGGFVYRFQRAYRKCRHLLIRTVAERSELMAPASAAYRFKALVFLDYQMTLSTCFNLCLPMTIGSWFLINVYCVGLGIPLGLAFLVLCIALMRTESKCLFWIIVILGLFQPICIIQVFLTMVVVPLPFEHSIDEFAVVFTLIFSAVAVAIRIALYICLVFMRQNFGKGLHSLMFRQNPNPGGAARRTGSRSVPYNTMDPEHEQPR